MDTFKQHINKAGKLSQVDPLIAKKIVLSGHSDGNIKDDRIKVKPSTWKASSLKPSQTSMVLDKSVGMALFMLKTNSPGGDLGAIVSSDNYIMDGHHRWSASIIAAGSKVSVGGMGASIKGKELLKILNTATKGMFGVQHGNKGSGALKDYTEKNVAKAVKTAAEKGIPGKFPWTPEDVQNVLIDNFGSVEKGIQQMGANAKLITTTVPSWAPDRVDMPVINPDQLPSIANKMNSGEIDHKAPFAESTEEDDIDEALTMQQRMKAKATFRKNKAKIKAGKRRAEKRFASPEKLKSRARKHARKEVEKKILQGKSKDELSFAQRQSLEKKVERKKAVVDRIARKLLPSVKKAEREKKRGGAKKD